MLSPHPTMMHPSQLHMFVPKKNSFLNRVLLVVLAVVGSVSCPVCPVLAWGDGDDGGGGSH